MADGKVILDFKDGWNNDCQRNKLMGLVQEKIVSSNKERGDIAIKTLFRETIKKSEIPIMYLVKKRIFINDVVFDKVYLFKENIPEFCKIEIKDYISEDKLLKVCSNEQCVNSKQSILYDKKVKKCSECLSELKKIKYVTEGKKELIKQGTREEIFNFLIENKLLISLKNSMNLRIDDYEFYENEIVVFESKNHYYSNKIFINHIKDALAGALIINNYSEKLNYNCKKIVIVVNGDIYIKPERKHNYKLLYSYKEISNIETELVDVKEYIDLMSKLHNIKIEIKTLLDFCINNPINNLYLTGMNVSYSIKEKKYLFEPIYQDNPPKSGELIFHFINIKNCKDFTLYKDSTKDKTNREVIVDELSDITDTKTNSS